MLSASVTLQIIVGLTIMNVWLLRKEKATSWRGGEATTMQQEFEVYGLPKWSMVLIGFLKVFLATMLLVGVWFPAVAKPAAMFLGLLMLGAFMMHIKVKDPLKKSLPAFTMLFLCIAIVLLP